jgi:hypothetical protein
MAMTVKQLKEALETLPDDMQVVMSKDAEGNDFSPVDEAGTGFYHPGSTWSGTFNAHLDPNCEVPMPESVCNAVCLWPVN